MSDKLSKSCFKMSNSFVMPDMVKSFTVQLTVKDFIGVSRKYQHIIRTQPFVNNRICSASFTSYGKQAHSYVCKNLRLLHGH